MARPCFTRTKDVHITRGMQEAIVSESQAGMSIKIMSLDRIMFELIKGEMAYVRDLENIETVSPLNYSSTLTSAHSLVDVHSSSPQR